MIFPCYLEDDSLFLVSSQECGPHEATRDFIFFIRNLMSLCSMLACWHLYGHLKCVAGLAKWLCLVKALTVQSNNLSSVLNQTNVGRRPTPAIWPSYMHCAWQTDTHTCTCVHTHIPAHVCAHTHVYHPSWLNAFKIYLLQFWYSSICFIHSCVCGEL